MGDHDELHAFLDCFHLIHPNLNDCFHYATADSERIWLDGSERDPEDPDRATDQEMLVDVWRRFGHAGIVAYVASIRGAEPLKELRGERYQAARDHLDGWTYAGD